MGRGWDGYLKLFTNTQQINTWLLFILQYAQLDDMNCNENTKK